MSYRFLKSQVFDSNAALSGGRPNVFPGDIRTGVNMAGAKRANKVSHDVSETQAHLTQRGREKANQGQDDLLQVSLKSVLIASRTKNRYVLHNVYLIIYATSYGRSTEFIFEQFVR